MIFFKTHSVPFQPRGEIFRITIVTDRRNGATDVRRNGATNRSLKRHPEGVKQWWILPLFW
jgi:hypothetical protein